MSDSFKQAIIELAKDKGIDIDESKLGIEWPDLSVANPWVNAFECKPSTEQRVLLMTESGEIVTGWLRKLDSDNWYYCFGNEFSAWDYEFNYDLGAVTHWMPLPEPPKL